MATKSDKTETAAADVGAPTPVAAAGKETPAELLERAAALLDEQKGPRANKFYRSLAAEVRRLAARAGEDG